MKPELPSETDTLVKYSRRSCWVALTLLLTLGAYSIVINVFPDGDIATLANRLFTLLPIAIIIALVAMRTSLKGVRTNPRDGAMKAVLNDELRQQSLSLSYRNGFAAALLAQPLLVLLSIFVPLTYPVVLMASATAFVGVVVVLCSLLAYDR